MKRADLQPGMLVATKKGPGSKILEKAMIVSTAEYQTKFTGESGIAIARPGGRDREEVEAFIAKLMAKGVDNHEAVKEARECCTQWIPDIVKCALVAEPWEPYWERLQAARVAKSTAAMEEEKRVDEAVLRTRKLADRLGVNLHTVDRYSSTFSHQRGMQEDFEVKVSISDLESIAALVDRLAGGLKQLRGAATLLTEGSLEKAVLEVTGELLDPITQEPK